MQNFGLLAWKMSELWLFEILTSEAKKEVEDEAEVNSEARYRSRSTTMQNFGLLPWKLTKYGFCLIPRTASGTTKPDGKQV